MAFDDKKNSFKSFIDECDHDTLRHFLLVSKENIINFTKEEIINCLDIKSLILSTLQEEHFFNFITEYYHFEKEESERKNKEYKRINEKFWTLTKQGNAVFFMIDPTTMRFTFSKGKGLKKLGLQQDEVVGKKVTDYYGDNESIMKGIKQASKWRERRGEINIWCFYFDVNFTPIFDEKGTVIDIVGMAFDVSRHKNLEERLQKLNTSKDIFLSIIAHDLRSPLGSIVSFLELLKWDFKEISPEELWKRIYLLDDLSNRSFQLLDRLLEWAKLQNTKITPEVYDLYEESSIQVKLLEEAARTKNIILENTIPVNTFIYADKRIINLIMRNLISNAIKFTGNKETGEKITISLENNNYELIFCVADTWIWINPDKKQNLFQIDKTKSTKGTSNEIWAWLWLFLCKEFIEKHKGKIRVERSEPGQGTIIKFSIPILSNPKMV